jgi:hypothetical protein
MRQLWSRRMKKKQSVPNGSKGQGEWVKLKSDPTKGARRAGVAGRRLKKSGSDFFNHPSDGPAKSSEVHTFESVGKRARLL